VPPHRDGGQAQFIEAPLLHSSHGDLAPLLHWLESNLTCDASVELLAKRAGMSPRTFARQFRRQTGSTPHQWLHTCVSWRLNGGSSAPQIISTRSPKRSDGRRQQRYGSTSGST
jgi:transcriptional regulator GlxA family with amidase domain